MNGIRRKICFVTGTRADYGIMSRLMKELNADPAIELQIVATNMHLSPAHGMTVTEIEKDGLTVSARISMNREGDTPGQIVRSMGEEMTGMADVLERLSPDLIVILGDRYEMLVAASAALIFSIPVAHLYGGEITEGANDDAIRNAITMLSSWHFTSTDEYRRRIIAMGKPAHTVFHVGALGADNISHFIPLSLESLETSIGFPLSDRFLLVTFHPATMEPGQAAMQTKNLLSALNHFTDTHKILFTMPNSDAEGDTVAQLIEQWVSRNSENSVAVKSLGRERYYTALSYAAAVIGNSSSGLTEAPSFGIPTVNIGNRQKGRAFGSTVIHCGTDTEDITSAINQALSPEFREYCHQHPDNPYALPDTLSRLLTILPGCI